MENSYYIGQFKNGKFNGKVKLYDQSVNIINEGDYVKHNIEWKGKLYFKFLIKNENILQKEYEGAFKNNEMEAIRKLVYSYGSYYIGQFKNNERNGKVKEYFPNGNYFLREILWIVIMKERLNI